MDQEEKAIAAAGELEIREVKDLMQAMHQGGLVKEWELPYEEIFSGLAQAVFFLTPVDDSCLEEIWKELGKYPYMTFQRNESGTVSKLAWRIAFNRDLVQPETGGPG